MNSIKDLNSCEQKLIPLGEEFHIVVRCIAFLAIKASYAEAGESQVTINLDLGILVLCSIHI